MPPRHRHASRNQMQIYDLHAPLPPYSYYNIPLDPYSASVPLFGITHQAPPPAPANLIATAPPFVPQYLSAPAPRAPPPPSTIYYSGGDGAYFVPPLDVDEPWLPSENLWDDNTSSAPRAAAYNAIAAQEMIVYLDQAAAARGKDGASRLPHLGPTPVYRTYAQHLIDAIGAPNETRFTDHARNISTIRDWTPPRLQDLAFCILWEVVTAAPPVPLSKLASLTCVVRTAFSTAADPEPYTGHIRRYAMATFEGWWKRDMPTSVFRVAPTARRAQTERALNLAIYMGHLYAAGYLSGADLLTAARTLVAGGLTHFEQLAALRNLLASSVAGLSGAPAAEQASMSAIMREVAAKGAGLREEQSLRGARVESAELRKLVDEILSLGRAGLGASFSGF